MRLWIRDTDDALPLTHRTWKALLWLAQATDAWVPAGSLRPRWLAPEVPWAGNYLGSDNQGMTAADCHALANALELARAMIPRHAREAELMAQVQLDLRTIDEETRMGGGPYFARPLKEFAVHRELCDPIPALVAFLRRVPLPDGELIVHTPEVAVRNGRPVDPP